MLFNRSRRALTHPNETNETVCTSQCPARLRHRGRTTHDERSCERYPMPLSPVSTTNSESRDRENVAHDLVVETRRLLKKLKEAEKRNVELEKESVTLRAQLLEKELEARTRSIDRLNEELARTRAKGSAAEKRARESAPVASPSKRPRSDADTFRPRFDARGSHCQRAQPSARGRRFGWTQEEMCFLVDYLRRKGCEQCPRRFSNSLVDADLTERLQRVSGSARTARAIQEFWRVRGEYVWQSVMNRKRLTKSTPNNKTQMPRWSDKERQVLVEHLAKTMDVVPGVGHVRGLTVTLRDAKLPDELRRVNPAARRTPSAIFSYWKNNTKDLRRNLDSFLRDGGNHRNERAKQHQKQAKTRTKQCHKPSVPICHDSVATEGAIIDNGTLNPNQLIRLRKTAKKLTRADGKTVYQVIPGINFCQRCKRTQNDGVKFTQSNAMCVRCSERCKELREAQKLGVDPRKKRNENRVLPPIGEDGKRDLLRVERIEKAREMRRAIIAGDIDQLNALKARFVEEKKKFRNMVEWDAKIFCDAAEDSKHPLRVINWALLNQPNQDEINEDAVKCAIQRCRQQINIPMGEGIRYVPAVKVLKHLVKCGFPVTCQALHTACAFGELDCVKYLRENVRCCNFSKWDIEFMMPNGEPNNLFAIAAQEGHVDVLQYLYDNDCDFSTQDLQGAMHLAKTRKPKRAKGFAQVKAYLESLPEWADMLRDMECVVID